MDSNSGWTDVPPVRVGSGGAAVLARRDKQTVAGEFAGNGETPQGTRANLDDDIPGPNKQAAELVRRLIGTSSLRAIDIRTGVNYRTIDSMFKGGRADVANTIRFSRSYKINPNFLLRLYGHETIPEFDLVTWENDQILGIARTEGTSMHPIRAAEIAATEDTVLRARIIEFDWVDPDGTVRPAQFEDLPPEWRRKLARALLRGDFDEPVNEN